MRREQVFSWGRLEGAQHTVQELQRDFLDISLMQGQPGICYGMGRSYGDVCLNPNGNLWKTRRLDKFIAFDECNGRLICEAGVLIADIQRLFIPRGWCLAVTPGTQMVTVGGAIANDVHGKNYHRFASFGNHIRQINLLRTNGEQILCGPQTNSDWFSATIGGLGLTGIILTAEIQLIPIWGPWLTTETNAYTCLDEFFYFADHAEDEWEHTVSWIDCLSQKRHRGIFLRANTLNETQLQFERPYKDTEHKDRQPKRKKIFFTPPLSLVNAWSLKIFNNAYYLLKKYQQGRSVVHYADFFYPLDKILEWNRIYGPKGFYQYQALVPRKNGKDAIAAMLNEIAFFGEGSFLSVLKTFSRKQSLGMLSFPYEGVTLALDFPNRTQRTLALFKRLDAIVLEAKGRLYLAKDARMSRELFEMTYPRYSEFLSYRDPGISSALSRRLMR